jgi:hypothetical protein
MVLTSNLPSVNHSGRTAQDKKCLRQLNTGIVGSNPTQGMDLCVRLLCVCAVLCLGSGLWDGWSPIQGVLPTVYKEGLLYPAMGFQLPPKLGTTFPCRLHNYNAGIFQTGRKFRMWRHTHNGAICGEFTELLFRWLVFDFTPRSLEFNPGRFHVSFLTDELEMQQDITGSLFGFHDCSTLVCDRPPRICDSPGHAAPYHILRH